MLKVALAAKLLGYKWVLIPLPLVVLLWLRLISVKRTGLKICPPTSVYGLKVCNLKLLTAATLLNSWLLLAIKLKARPNRCELPIMGGV